MFLQALSSGSQGNAIWVSAGHTNLMIDCGLFAQDLIQRTRAAGHNPRMVHAILITHAHLDHIRGLRRFAKYCGAPVYMESHLRDRGFFARLPDVRGFHADQPFTVGDFECEAFRVSHDAHPTVGFRLRHGALNAGLTTDLGCAEGRVCDVLKQCQAIYLEANHDRSMLLDGPYADALKARVDSDLGHLSNDQAAAILEHACHPNLKHVVLAHLSETNNTPELARATISRVLTAQGVDADLIIANQDRPTQPVRLEQPISGVLA